MVSNNTPTLDEISFEKLSKQFIPNKKYVILLECGAYSPPTNMHLRILEDAKNSLEEFGYQVMGGFMSPVHHKYNKKTLAPSQHRLNMVKLASETSEWINYSSWELSQPDWTPTAQVLELFSKHVNEILYPGNHPHIEVRLVCGSDVIYTFDKFNTDGSPVWTKEDQEIILGKHGLVCIERDKYHGSSMIETNPLLNKYIEKIHFITLNTMNTVSSTCICKLLREGKSIKYLVPDEVEKYIYDNNLNELPEWQE